MTTLADAGEALSKAEIAICQNCKHWGDPTDDNIFTRAKIEIRPCTYGEWADVQDMPADGMAILSAHDGPIYTGPLFGCVNFEVK